MQLAPTEDQQSIIELTRTILDDQCSPTRSRAVEDDSGEDLPLWRTLVDADLAALSISERAGGGGYGIVGAVLVAEEIGAHTAAVPFVDAVCIARALDREGQPLEFSDRPDRLTLREGPDSTETLVPSTTATSVDDGWTVNGTKSFVGGPTANRYLVSATTSTGRVGLFLVEASHGRRTNSVATCRSIFGTVDFTDAPAQLVVVDEGAAIMHVRDDAQILRCAMQAGIARGALAMAASYCSEREQFNAKIGTFQAVAHRLADAWIDANAVEMTTRQAAWRLDEGQPHGQALASAVFWATEATHRVVHAAQHVHGGIGVDTDYPVHRFFRWAKTIEVQLGGGSRALALLGDAVANEPLTLG